MADTNLTQQQTVLEYENQLRDRVQQGDGLAAVALVEHFERKGAAPNLLEAQTRINLLTNASNQNIGAASILLGHWHLTGHYVNKDIAQAILFFEHAGKICKDANGFYRLAEIFERGLGMPANPEKAASYLNKAVEMKHPDAIFTLGTQQLAENPAKAFELLKENYLKNGHIRSLFLLNDHQSFDAKAVKKILEKASNKEPFAAALLAGQFVQAKEFEQAQPLIEFAKQANNPIGYYVAGLLSQQQENYEQAHQEMLIAAQLGHTEAAYRVAITISQQLPQMKDEATNKNAVQHMLQLFAQAAQEGHAGAQYSLAQCWLQGIGVEQNQQEAIGWLDRAAQQGHVDAIFTLGINLPTDHAQHLPLLQTAAQAGHTKAMLCVGLYLQNHGQAEQAIEWFNQAKAYQDPRADYLLAQTYLQGIGVEADSKQAIELLKVASENGDADAHFTLYEAYRDGVGVRRNKKSQAKYLKLAQDAGHIKAIEIKE